MIVSHYTFIPVTPEEPEWRLDLLFKYAGSNLNRWKNAIGTKIQKYNGDWGVIVHINNNNQFITDVHSEDIYIGFSCTILQFSWHELHYYFQDIEFTYDLLIELSIYFNSEHCKTRLNPQILELLEQEIYIESTKDDERIIASIEKQLLYSDDWHWSVKT